MSVISNAFNPNVTVKWLYTFAVWKFSKCWMDRIERIDRIDRIKKIDPLDPIDPTLRKYQLDPIDPIDLTLRRNQKKQINSPRVY